MSTEPHELDQRLARLAPTVDVSSARARLRARQARSRRQRRVFTGAVAVVCLTLLATAVAVTGSGAGDRGRSRDAGRAGAGDPAAGARSQGDVATGGATPPTTGEPRTTTAEEGGIEVQVTVPERAVVGTRLWFDVVVRNRGTATVFWEAGGCGIPVEAAAGPASTVALDPGTTGAGGPGQDEPPVDGPDAGRWDGDVDHLALWLETHNALATAQVGQPDTATAVREPACALTGSRQQLAPGAALRHRGSVELRVPPGDLPDGGDYQVLVCFQPDASAGEDWRDPSVPAVIARAPVTLVDDPAREPGGAGDGDEATDARAGADAGSAVAAFADDARLEEWLAATGHRRGDLVQAYATELSWWRGAWELWVEPRWGDSERLRMRYDPVRDEVADVRISARGRAPDDEPGRSSSPDDPRRDEVLPPVD